MRNLNKNRYRLILKTDLLLLLLLLYNDFNNTFYVN